MARASRETGGVWERERRVEGAEGGESRRAATNGEREREKDNERAARERENVGGGGWRGGVERARQCAEIRENCHRHWP